MKSCPNCKSELDDSARFCLCCMSSLDEKELILPSAPQVRRWPLVLFGVLILGILGAGIFIFLKNERKSPPQPPAEDCGSSP